jgi:hypothetical protein
MDMTGKLTMGKNAVAPDGRWFDESRGESTDGLSQVMVGCNMSFRREALRTIGGFDSYFRYHQDETDACLGVLHAGYKILYQDGAAVWHEWCEGSYRKDRIKWYLRLRYMWGRNTAYLVRKHFNDRVGLSTAGNLDELPWEVAAERIRLLGDSARIAADPSPENLARELDPRAFDARGAALGRAMPSPPVRRAHPADPSS